MGDSHRLATGGCSGKLCLWDLRRPHTVEVEIPPYLDLNGAAKEENGEAISATHRVGYPGIHDRSSPRSSRSLFGFSMDKSLRF